RRHLRSRQRAVQLALSRRYRRRSRAAVAPAPPPPPRRAPRRQPPSTPRRLRGRQVRPVGKCGEARDGGRGKYDGKHVGHAAERHEKVRAPLPARRVGPPRNKTCRTTSEQTVTKAGIDIAGPLGGGRVRPAAPSSMFVYSWFNIPLRAINYSGLTKI